jgi:predicted amidohydrolase YtcJ
MRTIRVMAARALLVPAIAGMSLTATAHPVDDLIGLTKTCGELTIFTAKRIITMNPGWPEAGVVAVCNGRIVSLGRSLKDLEAWTRGRKHVVDRRFDGKVITPGFIDAHQHPLLGAISMTLPLVAYLPTAQAYGPDVPGVKSEAEALARLRRYDAELKDPAATLVVWGWDVPAMGRHLTRQDLDRISTTRAIVVSDASQHHAYVNGAFIAKRRIGNDVQIVGVGRDASGELNGQFLGVAAASFAVVPELRGKLEPATAMGLMRWLVDLNRRNGITTTTDHTLGLFAWDLEVRLLGELFNHPDTPQRLLAIPGMHTAIARFGATDRAIEGVRELQRQSTDKLMFNGIKFFTDDSFNGLTFMPGTPGYVDGTQGIWVMPPEKLAESIEPWWKGGQQIFVHSIGEEAHDSTLAALQRLQNDHARVNHRFTLEHFGMARYDQIRKLKALGAAVNVNVYYLWLRGEMYRDVLGSDRAALLAPVATLLREGVPTTFHSDTPVAPPRPLLGMSIAMARYGQSGGATMAPDERVSFHQALRMVTVDAAYVLGIDHLVGTIEPGKLADFTVLDQDPSTVRARELPKVPIWGTVVGGRVFPASEIRAPR